MEEQESSIADMEANSLFGQLKYTQPWDLETVSLEECGLRKVTSPKKRAKLEIDHMEEMSKPLSVSQLQLPNFETCGALLPLISRSNCILFLR
jgi:hypothetical protein